MLYFTFSKGTLKEMIYSERDFYSVSKPIFSCHCLKKKKKKERQEKKKIGVNGGGETGMEGQGDLDNAPGQRMNAQFSDWKLFWLVG